MFGLLVIVITFLIAVAATVLALKLPAEFHYWRFITVGIAVGLLLGAIFYRQQMRSVTRAGQDRDSAIAAASSQASETGKQYDQQVKSLTKQVVSLEAQLSEQAKKLDVVGDGSVAAASKATGGGALNPNDGATPSIFWIQGDENPGKGAAEVKFRIYGPLNVPAFIAVCDRPCRAVGGQAGAGSEGIPLVGAADRDVAGFLFKKPRPMPLGTEGTVTVQSADRGPIKVTAFRILRESEVPAGLLK